MFCFIIPKNRAACAVFKLQNPFLMLKNPCVFQCALGIWSSAHRQPFGGPVYMAISWLADSLAILSDNSLANICASPA